MTIFRTNINKQTEFYLKKQSINFENNIFLADLYENNLNIELKLLIYYISEGGIRFRVEPKNEENFTRYDITKNAIIINEHNLNQKQIIFHSQKSTYSILSGFESTKIEIHYNPLKVIVRSMNQKIVVINNNNFLNFNIHTGKDQTPDIYDNFIETRKNGITVVSCDFEFPDDVELTGFGSRSKTMNLQNVQFRMANFGGFSNYGTVPYFIAHSDKLMASIFWINPTDTIVNISQNHEAKIVKLMSESGFIDFIINTGTFPQIMKSYTNIIGKPMMPPLYSFGYHQSRWGYQTQEAVEQVISKLDESHIPFDFITLDIDHLANQSPYTINATAFPHFDQLVQRLKDNNRYLIRITDPHIPVDHKLAQEGIDNSYFILNNSQPFVGECWPGKSMWPDFMNPKVVDWWGSQFTLNSFPDNVWIWNDMNEPSVFYQLDGTIPKSATHIGGYEDREVHNIYGLLNGYATYQGLLRRNPNERPFILSRSYFSGSQKYVCIWTGDNQATWNDLEESIAHIFIFGLCGFPYVGADVGGFKNDPSPRLLLRWFQAAAWTNPFFREHSIIDSKSREPYLYDEPIHTAIRNRYKLLPLFYTAARKSNLTGMPIVRPLWTEYPDFPKIHSIQNQVLVADSLVVCPVVSLDDDTRGSLDVYPFPGLHYDFFSGREVPSKKLTVDIQENIPVFIIGGKIFLTFSHIGSTVNETYSKPLTLHVALDENDHAEGEAYFDDGHSFNFLQGEYFQKQYSFHNGILSMRSISRFRQRIPSYIKNLYIDTIKIYGSDLSNKKIQLDFDGVVNKKNKNLIVIENLKLALIGDFTLFDGTVDSPVNIKQFLFMLILVIFFIAMILPVFTLCYRCVHKDAGFESAEEILINNQYYPDYLDDTQSFSYSIED